MSIFIDKKPFSDFQNEHYQV